MATLTLMQIRGRFN